MASAARSDATPRPIAARPRIAIRSSHHLNQSFCYHLVLVLFVLFCVLLNVVVQRASLPFTPSPQSVCASPMTGFQTKTCHAFRGIRIVRLPLRSAISLTSEGLKTRPEPDPPTSLVRMRTAAMSLCFTGVVAKFSTKMLPT